VKGLPEPVARKHYSLREIYWISFVAAQTAMATRRLDCEKEAAERVMLAVTEVNGCALCSHAHARWALDMGLSDAEVRGLLSGVTDEVPDEQLAGIAFAQHYADTRGNPDASAWQTLVQRYGSDGALCVLRAARMMMWGNATGIPLSSLRQRRRGVPDPGSSLRYEVVTSALALPVTLLGLVTGLAAAIGGRRVEPGGVGGAQVSVVQASGSTQHLTFVSRQ
jgi:AhpD family alkylhydroperoxidase